MEGVPVLKQKHRGRGPEPISCFPQRENPFEKSFFGFDWGHKLPSPASLLNDETLIYKSTLWLEPYKHLQTTELMFRVHLIAQVSISFWYIKQPYRRAHIWADSWAPAACSLQWKTDDSPHSVPSSSFDNKLVSNSTCAQVFTGNRNHCVTSLPPIQSVTSWIQFLLFMAIHDRIFSKSQKPCISFPSSGQ